ncbi:MAG: HDOD domain-containing protein [Steroidobacterales bacterium]
MHGNGALVHERLEKRLAQGELEVPMLPEIAVRVMRLSSDPHVNAGQLAALIKADVALSTSVLRVANGVTRRPVEPIQSLQQAVAWLGFDETASLAFTLVVQGKLLNIPGQNLRVRRLWRHALASALWARQLAQRVAYDPNMSYLCALLHNVGKPVTLGIVHDIAARAKLTLQPQEYDWLIETFHRPVGLAAAAAWSLPQPVLATMAQWEAYGSAGDLRIECNIVALAHRLADFTLDESSVLARDLLAREPVYLDLGLESQDAIALSEAIGSVRSEVDAYFPA